MLLPEAVSTAYEHNVKGNPMPTTQPQTSLLSSEPLPNSKKIYIRGKQHPEVNVPFREIELTSTTSYTGATEVNEPIRVYDCSGVWGDPAATCDVRNGIPALRGNWIQSRNDTEQYEGRKVTPRDNGYLTEGHE